MTGKMPQAHLAVLVAGARAYFELEQPAQQSQNVEAAFVASVRERFFELVQLVDDDLFTPDYHSVLLSCYYSCQMVHN